MSETKVRRARVAPGTPILDRLRHHSDMPISDADPGCWVWRGTLNHSGYGSVTYNGRTRKVHRLAYELLREPIPPDKQIDHLCRVRACWRPDHLQVVTPRENVYRAIGQPAVANSMKTHCNRGHLLSGGNLRINIRRGRPQRECLKCKRIRGGKVYDPERRALRVEA